MLLTLIMLATVAEVFSIGAVVPFLGVLTAPDQVFSSPHFIYLNQWLNFTEPSQLLAPLTILFGCTAIIAGGMRLLLLWTSTKLTFAIGSDFSKKIYWNTLNQPYAVHASRNSSEIVGGIVSKVQIVIYGVINPTLNLIAGGFMLTIILTALLLIDPIVSGLIIFSFAIFYGAFIYLSRKRLKNNAEDVAHHSGELIKTLQEGLGGIRDVVIDGSQAVYCQKYSLSDAKLRSAQASNQFITNSPRYVMEALGMSFIALFAFLISNKIGGIAGAVPLLGALALGAQRLLPVLQQIYSSWSNIQGSAKSLTDTIDLLRPPYAYTRNVDGASTLCFNKEISFKDVYFRYTENSPFVLNKINLSIPKGSCIGVIGSTGGGKSTLLDILMALLEPTSGTLEIDGTVINSLNRRALQRRIAHVPQSIFLSDTTIAENIAFGVPKDDIDLTRIHSAVERAQLTTTIRQLELGLNTRVGERGIRLSGGQRQRIGIARALYKKSDIIILDEATSALDNETETSVMKSIIGAHRDFTLIIVAHRLTTLKSCDRIIEIRNGEISRVGDYASIIGA